MTNIDQLFCTPDQRRRLKELVPSLTSVFVWYPFKDGYKPIHNYYLSNPDKFPPAVSLQELMYLIPTISLGEKAYPINLPTGTAPELAAWVIKRLGEVI